MHSCKPCAGATESKQMEQTLENLKYSIGDATVNLDWWTSLTEEEKQRAHATGSFETSYPVWLRLLRRERTEANALMKDLNARGKAWA